LAVTCRVVVAAGASVWTLGIGCGGSTGGNCCVAAAAAKRSDARIAEQDRKNEPNLIQWTVYSGVRSVIRSLA
jgi:hypothetical protein